jgi:hypothetical protein
MFHVSALGQSPVSLDVKHDTLGQLIKPGQSVRTDVELALVNITVTDPHDRLVTGLEADNFRIFEDNIEQEVVTFSSEDVPISIGVVPDLSGRESRPAECLREPLAEPDMNLSAHPAPIN